MRLSDLHPKRNFSYIFVQFPGMKMNVPMLSSGEGKAVKEDIALCVQLNSKEKVHQLYFIRTQSIRPFDFTDEGIGAKAFYRVVKQKESSQNPHMEDNITIITDEIEIVQKKTETGYNFILVLNKREIGIVAQVEEEVFQSENKSLLMKKESKELVAAKTASNNNTAVHWWRGNKEIYSGGNAFQDIIVIKSIRILFEGVKRKVTVFSPAALDFIGPGDWNHTILKMRRC